MTDTRILDAALSIAVIEAMAEAIEAQKEELSALDSTVGDGDHGHNLAKALAEAVRTVKALDNPSLFEVWRTTGKTVQDSVGGASGLLFGAFFSGAARAVKAKTEAGPADVVEMLASGLAQVQKRGKAQAGDKTMVDALIPAVQSGRAALAAELSLAQTLSRAADAAQAGAEATRPMIAKHGRAKFLADRSQGYQDAGATSIALMLGAWAGQVVGN
ncbi:MAG: dihydroxyacetone kinase subunit DhaL [Anaerolineae bacterium]|nr:dihydroxyacetone kinase subunit DhaL [Anaerolineae bacterium]